MHQSHSIKKMFLQNCGISYKQSTVFFLSIMHPKLPQNPVNLSHPTIFKLIIPIIQMGPNILKLKEAIEPESDSAQVAKTLLHVWGCGPHMARGLMKQITRRASRLLGKPRKVCFMSVWVQVGLQNPAQKSCTFWSFILKSF